MLPLRAMYVISSSRGSLVIFPSQNNSIYIALGFSGQTIHPDCFSFPCSIGVDFLHHFVKNLTSECMDAFTVALISFF
jgi:hypothetical protein